MDNEHPNITCVIYYIHLQILYSCLFNNLCETLNLLRSYRTYDYEGGKLRPLPMINDF